VNLLYCCYYYTIHYTTTRAPPSKHRVMEYNLTIQLAFQLTLDNERILVVITKPRPKFGKRILKPQLCYKRAHGMTQDYGFWI
jgi:hypothetical protein